jgi:hypothetical protein
MFIGRERAAGGMTVPFSQVPREYAGLARAAADHAGARFFRMRSIIAFT